MCLRHINQLLSPLVFSLWFDAKRNWSDSETNQIAKQFVSRTNLFVLWMDSHKNQHVFENWDLPATLLRLCNLLYLLSWVNLTHSRHHALLDELIRFAPCVSLFFLECVFFPQTGTQGSCFNPALTNRCWTGLDYQMKLLSRQPLNVLFVPCTD